jgi:7,8-dihydropterin-6-yl-methyl-4-(beta-D-ribofuranosyl)aminobenzene 5'-phosphate synthase
MLQTPEITILFDTGSTGIVVPNADLLGLDLENADVLVLSHGHFDHTGGMKAVLRRRKEPLRTVAHPEIWGPKYGRVKKTGFVRFIGVPFCREELESLGAKFELTVEPTWLSEDIVTSGQEPMSTPFEEVASNLLLAEGGDFVVDSVLDDQSIFVRTDQGLVILLGCAHRGMINIIEHAQELTGEERVYMILGGTHLGPASSDQQTASLDALEKIAPRWIGVSHCTGLEMAAEVRARFPGRFFFNNAGTTVTLPRA